MIKLLMEESKKKIPINETNASSDLSYNKIKIKQVEFRHDGKRQTKNEYGLTPELDKTKMKSSIRANYIHTLDAALVH
jgi:hypothetical protein